jgi:hypothetical protein
MLRFPDSQRDVLALSDWLELKAILSDDKDSSLGDLERALTRESVYVDESEALENKLADVAKELDARALASGSAYPFKQEAGRLQAKGSPKASTYIFCLCLSYFRGKPKKGAKVYPARMFEALSVEAARTFVTAAKQKSGASRFGTPRYVDDYPSSFKEAINTLCSRDINEGGGWPASKKLTAKQRPQDGGLDVVAWREWRDKRPGKLILFGACAAGGDWAEKTRQLDLGTFCPEYLAPPPVSRILRAFFVPHRIHTDQWDIISRQAGLLFDRCRISYLVPELPDGMDIHGDAKKWIKTMLK